jgi:hypothetical protein
MVSPYGERGWNNQAADFRITIEGVVEQLLLDLKGTLFISVMIAIIIPNTQSSIPPRSSRISLKFSKKSIIYTVM